MPSVGSCVVPWLEESLSCNRYPNLRYLHENRKNEFSIYIPRKGGKDYTKENIQIFKDYDSKSEERRKRRRTCLNNENQPNEYNYSYSRQLLISALRNSVFITELDSDEKDTYKFCFNTTEEIQKARKAKKQKTEEKTSACLEVVNIPLNTQHGNTDTLQDPTNTSNQPPCTLDRDVHSTRMQRCPPVASHFQHSAANSCSTNVHEIVNSLGQSEELLPMNSAIFPPEAEENANFKSSESFSLESNENPDIFMGISQTPLADMPEFEPDWVCGYYFPESCSADHYAL